MNAPILSLPHLLQAVEASEKTNHKKSEWICIYSAVNFKRKPFQIVFVFCFNQNAVNYGNNFYIIIFTDLVIRCLENKILLLYKIGNFDISITLTIVKNNYF